MPHNDAVIKLTVAFDGSAFAGYELQPGKRTVRGELAAALKTLYGRAVKFPSSSRTDAGVHALGLVVSYRPPFAIPVAKLPVACNALLPDDLRVLAAEEKGKSFNARFDAKAKTYEYLVFNGQTLPPHLRRLAWQVKPKLDLKAMKKAAKYLVGKHDFSSFCASGSDDRDRVRVIRSLVIGSRSLAVWSGASHRLIRFQVTGNGFLYKMVRNAVGTLVEVGLGKLKPEAIKSILAAKDRRRAGKTAPAQGLCLVQVSY